MIPILFVHGFGSNKSQYGPIIRYLRKKGFNNFYEFEYKNKFGQVHIKELANELSKFIDKNINETSINIVGFSQGGIIALAYLKYFKNRNIEKLFTLCSPYEGSLLAYLASFPGFIDLRPNSILLCDIKKFAQEDKTNIFSVYTPFDLMVFPGWNAKPKYGKTKMVLAPLHPVAFFWPATKKFIYKNII
jgi:triacylglycerol lipase